MPNYLLCCTVCSRECGTRMEWLAHLLEPSHQAEAVKEAVGWSEEDRRCTLVAFGTFSVACMELLQFFSGGAGGCGDDIVTDFVYDKSRPKMGILQFESRKKVSQILKGLGKREVRVKDELVNLRMGEDYLQLEWDALLPVRDVDEAEFDHSTSLSHLGNGSGSSFLDKQNLPCQSNQQAGTVEDKDGDSSSSDSSSSDRDTEEYVRNGKCTGGTGTSEETSSRSSMSSNPSSAPEVLGSSKKGKLWDQFQAALAISAIPDNEYEQALGIMETLKREFRKKFPLCNIYMTRHWYLKMRSMEPTELLLFVDYTGQLHEKHVPALSTSYMVKQFVELISSLHILAPGQFSVPAESNSSEPRGYQYVHAPSGLKFCLVYQQPFLIEAQTCNLFKYLCEFDPRVRPLIGLIFAWVKSKDFRLSPQVCSPGVPAPEPAAWQWLIMLFLSGNRLLRTEHLVPSPNEILQRQHIQIQTNLRTDIGFTADMGFAKGWSKRSNLPDEHSDEFILDVLSLVSKFFLFCNKLDSASYILNAKHGEVIKKDVFFSDENLKSSKTKLTLSEISTVRKMVTLAKDPEKCEESQVFLLHPMCASVAIPLVQNKLISEVCRDKFHFVAFLIDAYIHYCRTTQEEEHRFSMDLLFAQVEGKRHRQLRGQFSRFKSQNKKR